MFRRCKYQVMLCIGLLLCGMPSMAQHQKNAVEDSVLLLKKRIKQQSLRLGAAFPECFSFDAEKQSTGVLDIEVREIHGNDCPGDPATSPIWNRFRIDKQHKIFWYDIANDKYLPFKALVKSYKK